MKCRFLWLCSCRVCKTPQILVHILHIFSPLSQPHHSLEAEFGKKYFFNWIVLEINFVKYLSQKLWIRHFIKVKYFSELSAGPPWFRGAGKLGTLPVDSRQQRGVELSNYWRHPSTNRFRREKFLFTWHVVFVTWSGLFRVSLKTLDLLTIRPGCS